MAANEELVKRIRHQLAHVQNVEEKKMFAGLAFMVNGKMCINVSGDNLMLRFDPDRTAELLQKSGVQPMIMKGRMYAGYCYVSREVISTIKELEWWCKVVLEYNPKAKASAKKRSAKTAVKNRSAGNDASKKNA